jgi:hypothetical protein
MRELPAESLIPDSNREEPPERFTHEVVMRQPFFFEESGSVPSGHLSPGTPVTVVKTQGEFSTVLDRRGVRVRTPSSGLRKL